MPLPLSGAAEHQARRQKSPLTIQPSVSVSSGGQEFPKTAPWSRAGETVLVQRRKGTLRHSCWLRRVLTRSVVPAAPIVEEPPPLSRLFPRQSERTGSCCTSPPHGIYVGLLPAQEHMLNPNGVSEAPTLWTTKEELATRALGRRWGTVLSWSTAQHEARRILMPQEVLEVPAAQLRQPRHLRQLPGGCCGSVSSSTPLPLVA
ncbi:hypothetical protein TraAM80_10459 [Trypanosoma rangeli]|uniref:Uncharacterized protein n=1 Tax=Trypanosoma rangeli TaxID=5698 RepID=A0A3R7LWM0_TRYRA|nr:uncharacterized protein TraAM80_10459 [Trypanosoma rangeli]RNE94997.1 hypothetical protein TraAM80_10459 [Trypanosoma rangeli]|eukprot:RNE94997.1 hypothetical protein TraAM80_10459 [Trypanosoma rangeli]